MYIIEYGEYIYLIVLFLYCMSIQWKNNIFDLALLDKSKEFETMAMAITIAHPVVDLKDVVNIKNEFLETPLMISCMHCKTLDLPKFILECKPELDATDTFGHNLFDYASKNKNGIKKQLIDLIGTVYLQTDEQLEPLTL